MIDWLRRRFAPSRESATFAPSRHPLYSEQAYARMLQFFSTVPDPDELLKQAGIRREQLRLLELDDEVSGRLEDRVAALIATPWILEPGDTRAARFVREQLEPHMDVLDRATISAAAYGYAMVEAVYRRMPSGRVGLANVGQKPLEWFDYAHPDGWRYHPDDGSGDYGGIPCDPSKFFPIVRNPTTRNPYGESILSRLWFPVTWRREGWGLWLNFLETFGTPIITANVRNYRGFVEAMQAQGVRSVVAWDGRQEDTISTLQASTGGEFERMENALAKRIQKLILGNTMTTDGGQYGSRASGEVGLQVEDARRHVDIRTGGVAINRLVAVLCELNGFAPMKFTRRDETGLEEARAARDADLAPVLKESGLKLTRQYFIDRYALEENELEEGEPEPDPPTVDPTVDPTTPKDEATMAAARFAASAQEALDGITDAALAQAPGQPIAPQRLRDAVMAARDKHDLERRLLALFESDAADPRFRDVLERAHFAAQVLGYVAAEERRV